MENNGYPELISIDIQIWDKYFILVYSALISIYSSRISTIVRIFYFNTL